MVQAAKPWLNNDSTAGPPASAFSRQARRLLI